MEELTPKKRGRKPKVVQVVEAENGGEITLNLHEEEQKKPRHSVTEDGLIWVDGEVEQKHTVNISAPSEAETEKFLNDIFDGSETIIHPPIEIQETDPLPTLTICILTIAEHLEGAEKLLESFGITTEIQDGINRFVNETDNIEALVFHTARYDQGGPTRGYKRDILLHEARGSYVVSIDSDDFVAPDYVQKITEALKKNPDCVGFQIHCKNGAKEIPAIASNRFNDWTIGWSLGTSGAIERTPYHKTPIRRSIALEAGGFSHSMDVGEDYDYSMRVLPFLKTEVFIPENLYFYWK